MNDSGSTNSIEVDGLAPSRMEVTSVRSVLLLIRSPMAAVLKDGESVVIGTETISPEVTILGATASVSIFPILADSTG